MAPPTAVPPRVDPAFERWAFGRRLRFLVWLSAPLVLGAVATIFLAAHGLGEPLRRRPTVVGGMLAGGWLVVTTLLAVLQDCPRCRKMFNVRGFARTPYSRSCLHCGMRAEAPSRRLGVARTLAVLFAPALLVSLVVLALERILPVPKVYTVTYAELLELSDPGYVTVVDGVPKPELAGSYVKIGKAPGASGGSRIVYQVVPLVPRSWTASKPVRVWILCRLSPETGDCVDPSRFLERLRELDGPLVNGRLVLADVTDSGTGWERSTTDAEKTHGITTDKRARFVSWPHHPERE